MMNKEISRNRKLGINVALMTIGTLGSRVLTFFLVPLYTSYLSTAEYGIADLVTTTTSLLAPILTVSIGEAVLRYLLDKEASFKDIFFIGFMFHSASFIILFFISPLLSKLDIFQSYIGLFLLYYLSYTFFSFFSFFARGVGKIFIFTIAGIIQTISMIVTNVISLVYFDCGVKGYLLAYIVSNFIGIFILFFFGRLYIYASVKHLNKQLLINMLKYSVPMIPNSISWWISNSSDKYIIAYFCGTALTGIYSVSYKIPTILSVVYGIFMGAWRLSAVEDFGTEENQKFYSQVYTGLTELLFVVAAGIILMNQILARILFANDFYSARKFVPILVSAFLLHGLAEFYGSIYTSAKSTKMLFYTSLGGALSNIILNIVLISLWGGIGAALATLMSYGMILLLRWKNTKRILVIKFPLKKHACCFFLLGVMTVVQTIEIKGYWLYSLILFGLITIVNKNSLIKLFSIVLHKTKA